MLALERVERRRVGGALAHRLEVGPQRLDLGGAGAQSGNVRVQAGEACDVRLQAGQTLDVGLQAGQACGVLAQRVQLGAQTVKLGRPGLVLGVSRLESVDPLVQGAKLVRGGLILAQRGDLGAERLGTLAQRRKLVAHRFQAGA